MSDINFLNRDLDYNSTDYGTCSEIDIKRAEVALGVVFPADYKDFLIKYNGGSFVECVFPRSPIGPLVVVEFLPFSGQNQGLIKATLNMREFLRKECLPFAEDPGGNVFFMNTEKNGVFFWEHETRDVFLLAENFSSFIKELIRDD